MNFSVNATLHHLTEFRASYTVTSLELCGKRVLMSALSYALTQLSVTWSVYKILYSVVISKLSF